MQCYYSLNLTSVMASYSPPHTLLQLLVFAVTNNSCSGCSSLEMFSGLSPVVPRASHTPNKWNLQPPPAQELNFNRTKQPNGGRGPQQGGKRISQRSPLGVRRTSKARLCWLHVSGAPADLHWFLGATFPES